MKRRNFLVQMGAVLACSQRPAWAIAATKSMPVDDVEKHLDLGFARRVKDDFLLTQQKQQLHSQILGVDLVDGRLNLSEYSSASPEALEYLASLNAESARIGFRNISPETAKALCGWNAHLMFTRVQNICIEAATYLGSRERSFDLSFYNLVSLDASCAERLACNRESMYLRLQTPPSLPVAKALATHQDWLSLRFPSNNILPSVAEALSYHIGYRLRVAMPDEPSETVLQRFALNPRKQIRIGSSTDPSEVRPSLWWIVLQEDYSLWSAQQNVRNVRTSIG